MEVDVRFAITRFPTVPTRRDQDFRDWFATSNDELRDTAEVKSRRLLRAADGTYTALVEHRGASTLAVLHKAEAVSMIQAGLGSILSDRLEATEYDVVVDSFPIETCCDNGHKG